MKNYLKNLYRKTLVFSGAIGIFSIALIPIYADSVSDAQNKVTQIQNQINSNNTKISEVEKEANSYLEQIGSLNDDITKYSNELADLENKKNEINKKISQYENMLQNSAQQYSAAEDMYNTRLRAIYENGVPNILDVLFNSEGITDFFSKLNGYQAILEYDKSLIGNVKNEKEYVSNIKKNIEEQKLLLDQLTYDIEKSKTSLANAKSAKEEKVSKLNNSKNNLKEINTVLEAKQEEAEKALQAEIIAAEKRAEERRRKEEEKRKQNGQNSSSNNKNSTYANTTALASSGTLKFWPTVTKNVTCGYYGYAGHTGVDFGVKSQNVFASLAGEVILAKYVVNDSGYNDTSRYTNGRYMYGNYILIKHSNGLYTLYAHLSSLKVKEGDSVSAGQPIGISGNTGNVSPRPTVSNPTAGSHLHFEVRTSSSYGSNKNPLSYLK